MTPLISKPRVTIYVDKSLGKEGWHMGAVLRNGGKMRELSAPLVAEHAYAAELEAVIAALSALTKACAVTLCIPFPYIVQTMSGELARTDNLMLWDGFDIAVLKHDITYQLVNIHGGHPDAGRAFALACGAEVWISKVAE